MWDRKSQRVDVHATCTHRRSSSIALARGDRNWTEMAPKKFRSHLRFWEVVVVTCFSTVMRGTEICQRGPKFFRGRVRRTGEKKNRVARSPISVPPSVAVPGSLGREESVVRCGGACRAGKVWIPRLSWLLASITPRLEVERECVCVCDQRSDLRSHRRTHRPRIAFPLKRIGLSWVSAHRARRPHGCQLGMQIQRERVRRPSARPRGSCLGMVNDGFAGGCRVVEYEGSAFADSGGSSEFNFRALGKSASSASVSVRN